MHADCILPSGFVVSSTAVLESKYLFYVESIVLAMFIVYLTKLFVLDALSKTMLVSSSVYTNYKIQRINEY